MLKVKLDVVADTKEQFVEMLRRYSETVRLVAFEDSPDFFTAQVTLEGHDLELIDLLTGPFYGITNEDVEMFIVEG